MADSTREFYYKLSIGALIDKASAGQVLELSKSKAEVTIDSQPCDMCLNSIKFVRKIYESGIIKAEVSVTKKSNAKALPSMDAVRELFLKHSAMLNIMSSDNVVDEIIAKNYYVHQVDLKLVKNNGIASILAKLTINSKDKLMAVDKYSKVYVAKQLATEILGAEYTKFGLKDTQVLAEVKNLRYLKFKNGEKEVEMIQPYLVQYNETFYDFLVRTANRCGEFLYFENGKLTLGLPASGKVKQINNYDSVTVQNYSDIQLDIKNYSRDNVKDNEVLNGFNDAPIEKEEGDKYPNDVFPTTTNYNVELVQDDFIYPLKKDNFTDFKNDLDLDAKRLLVDAAKSIATNEDGYTGIPEMARSFASDLATSALMAVKSSNKTNSEGNKDYVNIFKEGSLQTDGTQTVQFATVKKDGWPTLDFYSNVRKHEMEQQQKIVCINLGMNYTPLNLGDQINIDGLKDIYIVIHVEMSSSESQMVWAIPPYMENNTQMMIPPMLSISPIRKSGPQTAFVTASKDPKKQGRVRVVFPWQTRSKDKLEALETAQKELEASLKTLDDIKAKVEDKKATKDDQGNAEKDVISKKKNLDKRQKDWEKDLKLMATPWIRVVSPMATDGGGAYFLPNEGDEVLVNFEYDNIERPYVVGSVYSKNLNEPNSGHSGSITLQTPNGQFISMSAPGGKKFLETLSPLLKSMGEYVPGVKDAMKKVDKEIAGSITMSDTYGMFNIEMSSHERKINIESPFGKVGISAFTGITINAPNGDIKIKGKNVSIEAGNNLTVKSGTNVKYNEFSALDTVKDLLKDTVKDAIKAGLKYKDLGPLMTMNVVDCALIRCVIDTFLKPVEGTLCIKSNNYMKLEAGKGKAEVPLERYSDSWQDYKKAEKDGDKQIVYSKISAYAKRMDQKFTKFSEDYSKAKETAYEKKRAYDWLVKHLVKEDRVNSLQDIKKEAFNLGNGKFEKYNADTRAEGLVKMESFKAANLQDKTWPGYWVSGFKFLRAPAEIQAHIRKIAEEYAEAVYNLQRIANSAKTIITDQTIQAVNKSVVGRMEDKETKWIDDIFKAEANAILESLLNDWNTRYKGAAGPKDVFLSDNDKKDENDPFVDTKLPKRVAMAKMLVQIHNHDKNKIAVPAVAGAALAAVGGGAALQQPGKFFKLSIDPAATIDKEFVKDNWKKIALLGDSEHGKIYKVLTYMLEFLGIEKQWKPLYDADAPLMGWAQKVWNDKSGQIIFSTKKGTTYALNGEQIEKYEYRTENNKDSLKKTLLGFE